MRRLPLLLTLALLALAIAPGAPPTHAQGTDSIDYGIVLPSWFANTAEIQPALEKARIRIVWNAVQPDCGAIRRGRFDWRSVDRKLGRFTGRGLPLLVTVRGGARCAVERDSDGGLREPKKRYRDEFAVFARRVVDRYGPESERGGAGGCCGIVDLEVWNEPNIQVKWTDPDGAEYGRFLKQVAEQVRRADGGEEIRIVSGGITSNTAAEFAQELYAVDGVRRSFDALGLHTYNPNATRALRRIARVRGVMRRNGDARTPIAITEHGWSTCSQPTAQYNGKCTTVPEQAAKLEALIDGLESKPGLGVDTFLWYTPQDTGRPANEQECPSQPKYFYGFFGRDGAAKPAWDVWTDHVGAVGAAGALDPVPLRRLDPCNKHG